MSLCPRILLFLLILLTQPCLAQEGTSQRYRSKADSLFSRNSYGGAAELFEKAYVEAKKVNDNDQARYALDGKRACLDCMNEFDHALTTAKLLESEYPDKGARFKPRYLNCRRTITAPRLAYMEKMSRLAIYSRAHDYSTQSIKEFHDILQKNVQSYMEQVGPQFQKDNFRSSLTYLMTMNLYVPSFIGQKKGPDQIADSIQGVSLYQKSMTHPDSNAWYLWKSSILFVRANAWNVDRILRFAEKWKSDRKLADEIVRAYQWYYTENKNYAKAFEYASGYRGRTLILQMANDWKINPSAPQSDTTATWLVFEKAGKYNSSHLYDSALLNYCKAAKRYALQFNWKQYVTCMLKSADAANALPYHGYQRNYFLDLETTWDYLFHAQEICEVTYPNSYLHGISLFRVADYLRETDDPDQSKDYFEKARSVFSTLQERSSFEGWSIFRLGNFLEYEDDYEESINHYSKALTIGQQTRDNILLADVYEGLGHNYFYSGKLKEALSFIDKSQTVDTPPADKAKRHANLDLVRGNIYGAMNETDKAIEYYRKANIYYKTSADTVNELLVCRNMIQTLWNSGKNYDVDPIFTRAIKLLDFDAMTARPDPDLKEMGIRFLNMIAEESNGRKNAMEYVSRAIMLNFYREVDFREYDPSAPNDPPLSSSLNENQDGYFNGRLLLESYQIRATLYMDRFKRKKDRGMLEQAIRTYIKSDSLIDRIRRRSVSESSKLDLAESASSLYEEALAAVNEAWKITGKAEYKEMAFHFIEKSKAGVLRNALAEVSARAGITIPDSLLSKEKSVKARINNLELQRSKMPDNETAATVDAQLLELHRQLRNILNSYETGFPSYYKLKHSNQVIAVAAVMQKLSKEEALIEYFLGEENLFACVVTKDKIDLVRIPTDSTLGKNIKAMRNSITLQLSDEFLKYSAKVYASILAPVRQQLPGGVIRLMIIPDGLLNYVPFESLTQSGSQGSYKTMPFLMKEFEVSYGLSASLLLAESPEAKSPEKACVAFAPVFTDVNNTNFLVKGCERFYEGAEYQQKDTRAFSMDGRYIAPLPATETEVTNITKLLKDKNLFATYFLLRDAREEVVKSGELEQYRYIHFATHGIINDQNPRLSGLLLSQDSTSSEDGILYSGEIYSLKLNAELVVLSACETGLGKIVQGEGVMGLTRGWLYAGTKNIIVSLWKVADASTSELMIEFYNHLLEGRSKSAALRSAKMKLLANDEYADPYYWAPFVLIGR
ncbi:MAG: CHAT domain-containing protein [Bacteroidetes bacterium]|nr:CHAT domain-containing protein [Bacteroidota bacterium]